MITIQGLTELQRTIADHMWQLDTPEQLEQYIAQLPWDLGREAEVVKQMIIAAELDTYMEITDEVRDYLCSC